MVVIPVALELEEVVELHKGDSTVFRTTVEMVVKVILQILQEQVQSLVQVVVVVLELVV
jgi:hypothetical protein